MCHLLHLIAILITLPETSIGIEEYPYMYYTNFTSDGVNENLRKLGYSEETEVFIQNVTSLLEGLLDESVYDKSLRPNLGIAPTIVWVNMMIRSMGPIEEIDMVYSLDCYFRQYWYDPRLEFLPIGNVSELTLSIHTLNLIWKPDTYFLNGKHSYLHTITTPNKLLRIRYDGLVTYSMRLTINADCPLYLRKYPLDSQYCPLIVGTYGYPAKDLFYRWKEATFPIEFAEFSMSQFELSKQDLITDIRNVTVSERKGRESVLEAFFVMKRRLGYYLLQIYLPSYLVVVISWISFWINREATPARVTLGITTMLTQSTLLLTSKTGLPQLDYFTALDFFMIACFIFVFAALIEFSAVNYFTITNSHGGEMTTTAIQTLAVKQSKLNFLFPKLKDQMGLSNGINNNEKYSEPKSLYKLKTISKRANESTTGIICHDDNEAVEPDPPHRKCWQMFLYCLSGSKKYRLHKLLTRHPGVQNSVSKIDTSARFGFPSVFIVLNIFYWTFFLYYFPDHIHNTSFIGELTHGEDNHNDNLEVH